ncbi:MAG: hypothetical protein ACK4OM_02950 [Alphaproteobacteria bacterium]
MKSKNISTNTDLTLPEEIVIKDFYLRLGKAVAAKQAHSQYRFQIRDHRGYILAAIEEIYEEECKNSLALMKISFEEVEKYLKTSGLLDRFESVSNKVESKIKSIRSELHNDIYQDPYLKGKISKGERDEGYVGFIGREMPDGSIKGWGEEYRYLYTQAIDNQLKLYFVQLEETLRDPDLPDTYISVKKTYAATDFIEDSPTDFIEDSPTDELRSLLSIARGSGRAFNQIFWTEWTEARKKEEKFILPKEAPIMKNFGHHLIMSYIEIVKEKGNIEELVQGWEEVRNEEEATSRYYRLMDPKYKLTAKQSREGIFYYLPEIVKDTWKAGRDLTKEVKDNIILGYELLGEVSYNSLVKYTREGIDPRIKLAESEDEKAFIEAAKTNNKEVLLSLFKKGTSPYIRDEQNNTPVKLLNKATRISLIGYILSFLMRRPEYELYYELKFYMSVYSLAVKRMREIERKQVTHLTLEEKDADKKLRKEKLQEEVLTIYHKDRVIAGKDEKSIENNELSTGERVIYTSKALEDASLHAYHRSSLFTYLLSFAKQVKPYKESGYYHSRDARVEYKRAKETEYMRDTKIRLDDKDTKFSEIQNITKKHLCKWEKREIMEKKAEPKFSERVGYDAHKLTIKITDIIRSAKSKFSSNAR